VGAWHGEDVFRTMVFERLQPEMNVLEVACAQGDLALEMAPRCRSVLAYDFTARYIDLARQAAQERGVRNVQFLVYNSAPDVNGGRPHLPAVDHSVDLFVNSKGPFHWVLDAPRVGRPGAVLLMLVPEGSLPAPWEDWLPEPLRVTLPAGHNPNWARLSIEQRLGEAGLRLHSWWDFDVPEVFPEPHDLFVARTWALMEEEAPAYQEVAPLFERIFKEFAGPQGLEGRRRRHIWKAVIPGG
jgi:SAM-dependent methyltransferase